VGLFWLLVIAAIKVGRWPYAAGAAGAGLLGFLLLARAIAVGRGRAQDETAAADVRATGTA
jgi:hypothetical protein